MDHQELTGFRGKSPVPRLSSRHCLSSLACGKCKLLLLLHAGEGGKEQRKNRWEGLSLEVRSSRPEVGDLLVLVLTHVLGVAAHVPSPISSACPHPVPILFPPFSSFLKVLASESLEAQLWAVPLAFIQKSLEP